MCVSRCIFICHKKNVSGDRGVGMLYFCKTRLQTARCILSLIPMSSVLLIHFRTGIYTAEQLALMNQHMIPKKIPIRLVQNIDFCNALPGKSIQQEF